jgi:2-methylisocitrate lyase-like PEP mutase family enzyme
MDQLEKAERFRALHERPEPLLLPNPWDPGTARLLASLGFEALGTTSLGVANVLGRERATAGEVLDNCRAICAATTLPVTADLENGYADDPAEAAKMIETAYATGAVGASIEDATGDPGAPIYEFGLAVDRVRAAVEVARGLPVPSCSPRGRRTCCTACQTSTTRSAGCGRSRTPAPTCCTRPGCARSTRCARSCRRSAGRSTS